MRGSGYFAVWFCIGTVWFAGLWRLGPSSWRRGVGLYGPFLPFVLATLAAAPYVLVVTGCLSQASLGHMPWSAWFFYGWLAQSPMAQGLLGDFHVNTLLVAICYVVLLRHYMALIVHMRAQRDVWPDA